MPNSLQSSPPTSPRRGVLVKVSAAMVALVSAVYLSNPGFGVFELLPDNLPGVGNLDEAFFTTAFFASLAALGVNLPFLRSR